MVAMSGGVDSSVAAALVRDAGHDAVGVTLRLWGGESDSGCCSVSDVDDARRVAARLGIDHHVFNFADDFTRDVVEPYVRDHADGLTPNPCIECNRHLKFDRLLQRAEALGFDAVATGHHARIVTRPDGARRVARGADAAKDQSYVLYVLGAEALARTLLPVGSYTKGHVRQLAADLGLPTAAKPDSQDVCFITSVGGRRDFLGSRIPLRPGRLVTSGGDDVGTVDAVELVTVGQRKGLGLAGGGEPRFALAVDTAGGTVTVGRRADLDVVDLSLVSAVWPGDPPPVGSRFLAQASAHGRPFAVDVVAVVGAAGAAGVELRAVEPVRRVAPGQSVVLYEGDEVVGGGIVAVAST